MRKTIFNDVVDWFQDNVFDVIEAVDEVEVVEYVTVEKTIPKLKKFREDPLFIDLINWVKSNVLSL